jgi:hypothetical protein
VQQKRILQIATSGDCALMNSVRTILQGLQANDRYLEVDTRKQGELGERAIVPLFVYNEKSMRFPECRSSLRRRTSFLTVGSPETVYQRLQMSPLPWIPSEARVCIVLWSDVEIGEGLEQALQGALHTARDILKRRDNTKGMSRRKERARQHAAQTATT